MRMFIWKKKELIVMGVCTLLVRMMKKYQHRMISWTGLNKEVSSVRFGRLGIVVFGIKGSIYGFYQEKENETNGSEMIWLTIKKSGQNSNIFSSIDYGCTVYVMTSIRIEETGLYTVERLESAVEQNDQPIYMPSGLKWG